MAKITWTGTKVEIKTTYGTQNLKLKSYKGIVSKSLIRPNGEVVKAGLQDTASAKAWVQEYYQFVK